MEQHSCDLLIIGAGPGGYVAAIHAAKKGLSVTLVERRWVGGTCLNAGCIPTKSLIQSADLFEQMQSSSRFGISAEQVTFDWNKIQEQKNKVTNQLQQGILQLLEKAKVTLVTGTARFLDSHTVAVTTEQRDVVWNAKNIIISTGASTKHLPISGIDSPFVIDSEGALSLSELPKSICVIGGGVIGMEFAFLFGRLGVKIQVLEFLPQILPTVDSDVIQRLSMSARRSNITISTNAKVIAVEETDDGKARVLYTINDVDKSVEADLVLEAVGRKADFSGLSLEKTGIELHRSGAINVDLQMRTNIEGIYAIGDCTNTMQLAHVASHQGIVAVDHILGKNVAMDYDFVPSVIFTSPEIATVGKTEKNLTDLGITYQMSKIPYGSNGKALILNQPLGFIKLLRNTESQKLLGATVYGADANALIATLTVALQNNLSTEDLKKTIFAHPTLSEIIHESALSLDKEAIHTID